MQRPNFITDELLDRFAMELIRNPHREMVAALSALNMGAEGNGLAIQLMQYVAEHAAFNERQIELLEAHGVILPPKEVVAYEILAAARASMKADVGKTVTAADRTFALSAYRLYAEMMNHMPKGGPSVAVQVNNVDRRVMYAPPDKTIDEWEHGAVSQQEKLIADAREKQ